MGFASAGLIVSGVDIDEDQLQTVPRRIARAEATISNDEVQWGKCEPQHDKAVLSLQAHSEWWFGQQVPVDEDEEGAAEKPEEEAGNKDTCISCGKKGTADDPLLAKCKKCDEELHLGCVLHGEGDLALVNFCSAECISAPAESPENPGKQKDSAAK